MVIIIIQESHCLKKKTNQVLPSCIFFRTCSCKHLGSIVWVAVRKGGDLLISVGPFILPRRKLAYNSSVTSLKSQIAKGPTCPLQSNWSIQSVQAHLKDTAPLFSRSLYLESCSYSHLSNQSVLSRKPYSARQQRISQSHSPNWDLNVKVEWALKGFLLDTLRSLISPSQEGKFSVSQSNTFLCLSYSDH